MARKKNKNPDIFDLIEQLVKLIPLIIKLMPLIIIVLLLRYFGVI